MSTLFAASEISVNISNVHARTYLHTYIVHDVYVSCGS